MKANAQFTFSKVKHDQDNDVHLVVSLTAPKVDWQAKRPPVCITLVADVSGSMGGDKLEYAKKSMLKLVDNLQPGDYCGLVTFESGITPVVQPFEMTQARKDDLKVKIGQLRPLGGTNFSGGMLQGLEYANSMDLPNGVVNRIIMFTDGCANEGIARTRPELVRLLTANLGKATLSAFGYGTDADQELLADVAKAGKGNYAFVKNPDDALSAFAKELGGLLSTYAQNVEVCVAPQNGHSILEVVSDVDVTDDSGKVTIKLPDVMGEEVRHLVLSYRLAKQAQALPREMSVADISLSYDLLTEDGTKKRENASVKAKIRFVKAGDEQTSATPDVDAIVATAQMVKVQIEAEAKANAGDYAGATSVMRSFSANVGGRGHKALAATSAKMGTKMTSRATYSANSGYLNSAKAGFTRGVGLSGGDAELIADLQEAGVSLSTSSQQYLTEQFNQDVVIGPGSVNPPAAPAALLDLSKVPGLTLAPAPAPASAKAPEPKSLSKKRSNRW